MARETPAGPGSWPPRARWPEPLHRAVHAVTTVGVEQAATESAHGPLRAPSGRAARLLVGLSGGADSLALCVAAAEAARIWRPERHGGRALQVGAVVVDHGLQAGSARVAARSAQVARLLGLDPVEVVPVDVTSRTTRDGPEAAARQARHAALEHAARRHGAGAVLLAHTREDQAEQVLLGLARGSGTRSLAGMPAQRGLLRRPLLDLGREDTEAICRWAGLTWWEDPHNADPAFLRSRVRTRVLPALEDPESGLGPGVREALVRSAAIAAEDAGALEQWAAHAYAQLVGEPEDGPGDAPGTSRLALALVPLAELPDAIRYRVIGQAVRSLTGRRPQRERILAVDRLVATRHEGGTSAGPVELSGGAVARRTGSGACARLVLDAAQPPPGAASPPD